VSARKRWRSAGVEGACLGSSLGAFCAKDRTARNNMIEISPALRILPPTTGKMMIDDYKEFTP
jgi:hypothetical protein